MRENWEYGTSTLQGGGGDAVDLDPVTVRAWSEQVDLELFGDFRADDPPYYAASDAVSFGLFYAPDETAIPLPYTGLLILFAPTPITDIYQVVSTFWGLYAKGMEFQARTITVGGKPEEFSEGDFRFNALLEVAPIAIGGRALSFVLVLFDTDNFHAQEFILYEQLVIPTVSEKASLTISSPLISISRSAYLEKAIASVTAWLGNYTPAMEAAGISKNVSPPDRWEAYVCLRFHQNSGVDIAIYSAQMSISRIKALTSPQTTEVTP